MLKEKIPIHEWEMKMKHYNYDDEFYQYTDLQMERMDNLLTSIEYDATVEEYISSLQHHANNWFYQDEQ